MFQWTCDHLQGIQSVTGAKASRSVNSSYMHLVFPEDVGMSIEARRDNVNVNITFRILCVIIGLF
jgi:hypothetical protein